MIRFVEIGDQISLLEEYQDFAWFDTVTDTFLEFNGSQTWNNWEEFEEDFKIDPQGYELERFKGLYQRKEK